MRHALCGVLLFFTAGILQRLLSHAAENEPLPHLTLPGPPLATATPSSDTPTAARIQASLLLPPETGGASKASNASAIQLEHELCRFSVESAVPVEPWQIPSGGFCANTSGVGLRFDTLRVLLPDAGQMYGEDALPPTPPFLRDRIRNLLRTGCEELRLKGTGNKYNLSTCSPVFEFGFGALLSGMVKAMTRAVEKNTPFSFASLDRVWAYRSSSFWTYFSEEALPCNHTRCVRRNMEPLAFHELRRTCRATGPGRMRCKPKVVPVGTDEMHARWLRREPSAAAAFPAGFWVAAELMQHLLDPPAQPVQQYVDQLLEHTQLEAHKPCLVVHIRRGDSCPGSLGWDSMSKARECSPLSRYVPHIHEMRRRYAFRSILVVTDDNAIRRGAAGLLAAEGVSGVRVVSSPFDTPSFYNANGTQCVVEEAADFDAPRVGQQFLAEVLLMSRAQAFIGKFTSNVFRNAYLLASVRGGVKCLKPVISIDAPFCFDFGNRRGVNCHTQKSFMC